MTEYGGIANKFGRVRRAWKRTAALSGLAVVLLESIGLLTTAIIIDLLFMPGLFGRIIILFVLAASFIWLLYKNTIKPILRHINDKQIALYVEEHYPKFEGALIAAAEFGPQADLDPEQRDIINTILKEAETRAQKFDLRKAIDFSRFKKYGIMAVALFVIYLGLSIAFPETATKRIERVLSPWSADKKEQKSKITTKTIAKVPIEFSLSKQTAHILRGTPFKLEVGLNRAPNTKVKLHFRSKMDAKTKENTPWNTIAMEEIDKLHGYSVNLPDVNESMEFFVSAEGYESGKNNIEVYDPLIVENIILVTQYPDYLQRPVKTENSPTGEINAIAGSKMTVKIITNRPLYEGKITIGNDQIIPATISEKINPEVAIATFVVNDSSTYTYRVEDGFGQVAESPAPAQIEVIKDGKPKIELLRPTEMLSVHPLGEVEIEAKANDDFGIASINLVYRRGADINAKKIYVPIPIIAEKGAADPSAQEVVFFWEMEKIKPKLKPQEVLTWYLEVKDRKGQTDETEIAFLPITHFETWATEGDIESHEGGGELPPAIDSILIAAWQIRIEKDMLSPKEVEQRIKDLAQIMIKPSEDGSKPGEVWQFLSPEKFPENPEFPKKINAMCVQAHGLLVKLKLDEGIDVLRAAVTELIAMGLLENIVMPEMEMNQSDSPEALSEFKANMEQMQQLETEASPKGKAPEKQTEKDIKAAEKAKEAEKKTAELEKKQDEMVKKAKELAKKDEGSKGKARDAKDEKAKTDLAEKQKDIADAAKKAAKEIKKDANPDSKAANAAKKLEAAAKKMDEAAKEMNNNNMDKGVRKAEEARKDLVDIKDDLMGLSQEKVAKLLEELEQKTERALRKQDEIQKNTENLAKNIETNKDKNPNAKQERDFSILTNKQADMRNNVEEIKKTIEDIDKMSKEGRMKPETANQMDKAKKDLRRSRLEKKITNASVELARKQAKPAVQEQKEAKDGLKKVLESIRAASDSLASDYESELRRANNEAKRVKNALEKLNPKAADKAKDPKDAQKEKKDEKAVTQEERKEKVEETSVTLGLLKRHLNRRNFLDKKTLEELEKKTGTPVNLEKALKDDSKEAVELQKLVTRIHNKLEAEYEMHVASKRLFTAQREDCPPQYRHMVNKYFEKLSLQEK